jgi:hypothetical protein
MSAESDIEHLRRLIGNDCHTEDVMPLCAGLIAATPIQAKAIVDLRGLLARALDALDSTNATLSAIAVKTEETYIDEASQVRKALMVAVRKDHLDVDFEHPEYPQYCTNDACQTCGGPAGQARDAALRAPLHPTRRDLDRMEGP